MLWLNEITLNNCEFKIKMNSLWNTWKKHFAETVSENHMERDSMTQMWFCISS